jgi:septum formation protein
MKLVIVEPTKNQEALLNQVKLAFTQMVVEYNPEILSGKSGIARSKLIARTRAESAAPKAKNALVVATDTIVLYRNNPLKPPKFKMDALEILKNFSGTSHVLVTHWYLINTKTNKTYQGSGEARVYFLKQTEAELTGYVNDHDVINWVAAYEPLQTKAIQFVEKIEGSVTTFYYQFPLEQLLPIIRKA